MLNFLFFHSFLLLRAGIGIGSLLFFLLLQDEEWEVEAGRALRTLL